MLWMLAIELTGQNKFLIAKINISTTPNNVVTRNAMYIIAWLRSIIRNCMTTTNYLWHFKSNKSNESWKKLILNNKMTVSAKKKVVRKINQSYTPHCSDLIVSKFKMIFIVFSCWWNYRVQKMRGINHNKFINQVYN